MKKEYNVGDKFNYLTFLEEVKPLVKGGYARRHAKFKCVCGSTNVKILSQVVCGKSKSCGKCGLTQYSPRIIGSKNQAYKHGMFGTRFYNIYFGMVARCKDKKNKFYYKKGIRNRWGDFLSFKNDMYSSYLEHVNKYGKKQTTLDRVESTKDYYKENCRWATYLEQGNNRNDNVRYKLNDKVQTLAQWCKELNTTEFLFKKKYRSFLV